MKKTNNNIYILLAYLAIQIVAIFVMIIVAIITPGILDDSTLHVEYSSYVNLFVMFLAFLYFLVMYRTYFLNQFRDFFDNFSKRVGFTVLTFLALYASSIAGAIIMDLLDVGGTSVNQAALDAVANSTIYAKISLVIFTVIFAPFIEEFVFRKAIFGLFGKYKAYVPILMSGVVFGLIHVIADPNLIQVIPYLLSGCILAFMFYISDRNIFVVIGAHAVYNLLGVTIMLLPEEILEAAMELVHLFI